MPLRRGRLLLCSCLLVAAALFLTGIDWGLPSRVADPFLFPDRPAWTGVQLVALTSNPMRKKWDDPNRGADVAAHPLEKSDQPIQLNTDLTAQGEILRRYRLFTHQPDEMITFESLAKMHPAQFDLDPRLYQYGGLWIYPVALLLKAGSALHLVDVRGGPDGLAFYYEHPEAFGRFYVVARLYVVMWGLIGVAAVFSIVRCITASGWAAAGAAICFAAMPVVLNLAHEAKPHLPGMVLVLLTVLAAAKYVETGKLAHAIAAGVGCGCALGMVLSALPVFSILAGMVLLRRMGWGDRVRVAIFCGLVGLAVYGATNPYVVYHLLRGGGGVLESNLGNSANFYRDVRPINGFLNVLRLMLEGSSPLLFFGGLIAMGLLLARAIRSRGDQSGEAIRRRAMGWLLAAPAVLTVVQASLAGADKPAEFGRFLLLPDVFLGIELFAAVGTWVKPRWGAVAPIVGFAAVAAFGWPYLQGFVRDRGPETSRLLAAQEIDRLRRAGAKRLLLAAEPAPYCAPPFDLSNADWPILILPRTGGDRFMQPGDVVVEVEPGPTPISWAAKPVRVRLVP